MNVILWSLTIVAVGVAIIAVRALHQEEKAHDETRLALDHADEWIRAQEKLRVYPPRPKRQALQYSFVPDEFVTVPYEASR